MSNWIYYIYFNFYNFYFKDRTKISSTRTPQATAAGLTTACLIFNLITVFILTNKLFFDNSLKLPRIDRGSPYVFLWILLLFIFIRVVFLNDKKYEKIYNFYKNKQINESAGITIAWTYFVGSFLIIIVSAISLK